MEQGLITVLRKDECARMARDRIGVHSVGDRLVLGVPMRVDDLELFSDVVGVPVSGFLCSVGNADVQSISPTG